MSDFDDKSTRGAKGEGREGRDSRDPRSAGDTGRPFFKKKVCRFCAQNITADYKNPDQLKRYVTERGKILPRRITGTCDRHQRALAREIKKARTLAYLPFAKK